MTDLILHHYAASPFSHKVRLVMGYKRLAWRSVTVPAVLPKPDVVALTGGYRRTPFLQVGADVYCDSVLAVQVLQRRAPLPSLFPPSAPLAPMIGQWADASLFWAVVPFVMQQPAAAAAIFSGLPPESAQVFRADRAAMTAGKPLPGLADAAVQVATYCAWLDAQLADGRPFLCGNDASIADFAVAHCLWFVRVAPPATTVLEPHPRLAAWLERVLSFGEGRSEPMSSADAITLAASSPGHESVQVQPGLGFEAGQPVAVSALDYGCDPVSGTLVGLTSDEVVVERHDPRAGCVHVHFPRLGYRIRRAEERA